MSITITVDDRSVMHELRRLEDGPDFSVFQEFASTVHLQYVEARLDVHKRTGSLYLSAKWDASQHEDQFEGEVSFGGDSPGGINSPVDYAQIERERGTLRTSYGRPLRTGPGDSNHDFMRGLPALESGYVEAILNFFRG